MSVSVVIYFLLRFKKGKVGWVPPPLFFLAEQGAFQCELEPVGLGEVTWKELEVPSQEGVG